MTMNMSQPSKKSTQGVRSFVLPCLRVFGLRLNPTKCTHNAHNHALHRLTVLLPALTAHCTAESACCVGHAEKNVTALASLSHSCY